MAIISIIVPIYNTSAYIERCAVSLFEQTFEDLEYLFIDDGSTDNSIELITNIIKQYPHRESQVRIVCNGRNVGITETRKRGLALATGEYVGWVDSDDWAELDMFESLYLASEMGTKDVVVCDYIKETVSGPQEFHHSLAKIPRKCLERINNLAAMPHSLWCQIIKRSLFPHEEIGKLKPSNWGEDLFLVIMAYLTASSLAHVRKCLYHYNRMNVMSVSRQASIPVEYWRMQLGNVNLVCGLLCDYMGNRANTAIHHMQFVTKNRYKCCFENERQYFNQWKECHRSILAFDDMPWRIRMKLAIIYSSYWTYSFYHRNLHA